MYTFSLINVFKSCLVKPSINTLIIACDPFSFLAWLSYFRYSSIAEILLFVDFFGLSFINGYFATIAIFMKLSGFLYKFVVISDDCLFVSGCYFFKGLEWYEREASELCGCFFELSVDRRILLLAYCNNSHPLQKTQHTVVTSRVRGSVFLSFITWCNI